MFNAWCIDFNNDVSVPGTYTYDEVALTTSGLQSVLSELALPEPHGVAGLSPVLNEISYLINLGLNLPTSTIGLTSQDDNQATAIQIAIWDILYGTQNVTVTKNGLDDADWTDMNDRVTNYLQSAGTPSVPVYALLDINGVSNGVQELAFAAPGAVPEPSSLALLAGAALGVTMLQRRKAKG